ncbi:MULTISPECIES: Gfo/Idh/MocA family protein [Olivibacter]|uniref:Gfo/Idh/MocA family protein n=1 Tax=Olivibacter jilunii TaxID=985016 RepID=A0ABW6B0U7_9SPHI|nr:Gfo/Idh/MocA family oxidoreductase [Olivibacter sp. UJ_SKK_5.1]MDX3916576.1 Gfo/Idh/MocA family oxidoreductase [Pseudosphingobacterium sp.]
MDKALCIGLIGYKFMGRAHSNAWKKAPLFFDLPCNPVLKTVCGRHAEALGAFAKQWGWEQTETDWRKLVNDPTIDVIDIALPQHLHHEVVIAAAKEGKHIFCEKPLAMSSRQAEEMWQVCENRGVVHYLNHNYRRVPAIALAKRLINDGKIGRIFHWRCAYQQDWIVDPMFPLTWQLDKNVAQAGPQWDLNSHAVDLAHYLVGEIKSVMALTANFVKERPLADESSTGNLQGKARGNQMGKVSVEDAALMQVQFVNGAIGSFEATRFATGRKNSLTFEIYGSDGSLTFNLERMNELQFFSRQEELVQQGFRRILATEPVHPYTDHWWPAGHIIGYEHTFVHAVADFMEAIVSKGSIEPNFRDGWQTLRVLEAGLESAKTKQQVLL